jgi:hypothetical protein
MKKNEIDDIFARKLRNTELEPRAEAWAKLQQRMAHKKNNRVVLWWQRGAWLAAASVILLSGALWWNHTPEPNKSQMASVRIPTQKTTTEIQVAAIEKTTTKTIVLKPKNKYIKVNKNIETFDDQIIIAKKETKTTPEKEIEISKTTNETPQNTLAENTIKTIDTAPTAERKVLMTLPEIAETIITEHSINDKLPTNELPASNKKNSRFAKVFRQLKNLKEGEKVDWNEVGFDPNNVLSKVGKKI